MKIIVSQQNLPAGRHDNRIKITFSSGKVVDNYTVDKAEDFLIAIDRFLKKRTIPDGCGLLRGFSRENSKLKFHDTGILTERVIRAIMLGLGFNA